MPDAPPSRSDVRSWTEQRFYDRTQLDMWSDVLEALYNELHRLPAACNEFEKTDLLGSGPVVCWYYRR